MNFDESLQQYTYEHEGVIFVWDKEPDCDFIDEVELLSKNYQENLSRIINFMLADLKGNVWSSQRGRCEEQAGGNLSLTTIKEQLVIVSKPSMTGTYLSLNFGMINLKH